MGRQECTMFAFDFRKEVMHKRASAALQQAININSIGVLFIPEP